MVLLLLPSLVVASDIPEITSDTVIQQIQLFKAEKEAELELSQELKEKASSIPATCSCIVFARRLLNLPIKNIPLARNYPVNSQTPEVGSILISYDSRSGHASTVVEVISDTQVKVVESNWIPCKKTERLIDTTKVKIKGFYIPDTGS